MLQVGGGEGDALRDGKPVDVISQQVLYCVRVSCSGGASILEQVGPTAGPKVIW